MKGPNTVRRDDARLDRNIQNEIGRNLRAMYNDIVEQGVPDRFADLLAKLENRPVATSPTAKKNDSRQRDQGRDLETVPSLGRLRCRCPATSIVPMTWCRRP